jgi:hypothetical protein
MGDSSAIIVGDRKDPPGGGWEGGCIMGGGLIDSHIGGGIFGGGLWWRSCGSRELSLRVLLLLLVPSFAHKENGGGQAVVRGRRNDGFCPTGLPMVRVCRGPGMSAGAGLLVRVGGVGLRRLLPSPFGD